MSTSANSAPPLAVDVQVSTSTLEVMLADGRTISTPLSWFPRHENGTADERARWQLIGGGEGVIGRISTRTSASKRCSKAAVARSTRLDREMAGTT